MRNWQKLLLTSLILSIAACGGKSAVQHPQIVVQPAKYCPRPEPPELIRPVLDEKTIATPVLLDDYRAVIRWALEQQATIDCYEGETE